MLRKFAQHFPDTYFSVFTLRKGFLYIAKATDVQVCVCPVPFHRDDLQVAPKVARVKAAEREPVAVPRQHRRRVQLTPVCQLRVEDRDLRCAIHVRPDAGQPTSRDPASFVRHLQWLNKDIIYKVLSYVLTEFIDPSANSVFSIDRVNNWGDGLTP